MIERVIRLKKIVVTGAGGPAGINFINSLRLAPEKFLSQGQRLMNILSIWHQRIGSIWFQRLRKKDYIDILNEIIRKEKAEFLHAQTDIEVAVVSENREKIEANVFLPSKRAVKICQDKLESAKIWMKKGIPVAKTMEIRDEKDVDKAFEEFGSPIWIRARHGAGGRGSTPAYNKETALSWINYWRARGMKWEFIAQEHLPGRNIGFHSLWKDGELVTSMARERIKYIYPHLAPSGSYRHAGRPENNT
jgi:glutathione synthase/RimK-type ligase-like ATP-grasp enzyme